MKNKKLKLTVIAIISGLIILPSISLGGDLNMMGMKIPTKFLEIWMPFGIAFDNSGNLLVSHSAMGADGFSLNEHLSRFSQTGQLQKSVITAGLFDPTVVSGNFVREPSSGKILCICNGNLIAIDPTALTLTKVFSIAALDIDTNHMFDVEINSINNILTLIPGSANYGDLAVYNRANSIELYIAGSYYSTNPFILKIQMTPNFAVTSAQVIATSTAANMVAPAPSFSAPGIAVSPAGKIVTTLPQTFGSLSSAANILFAFDVDFDPSDGIQTSEEPRRLFHKDDVTFNSRGMTCDTEGNFYMTTDFIGAKVSQQVCDQNVISYYNASMLILSSGLDRILDVLYPPTSEIQFVGLGDVVLSPDGGRAFISIFEYTTNPYSLEDKNGRIVYYPLIEYTSVEVNERGKMADFQLFPNFPNPFNATTMLSFSIPEAEAVSLTIYNIAGQEIAKLLDRNLAAGKYQVPWDAAGLPSGTYFCRILTPKFNQTRKLTLLK